MDKFKRGICRLNDILGDQGEMIVKSLNETSEDFAKYIVEHVYGDIYARSGLNDKTRELIGVTALITQGNTGVPLKAHLQGMLNVGWTKQDIIEMICYLTVCIGYPSCVDAMKTFQEVIQEL